MTYRVIKTIGGRRYIYEQCTHREGKRVRTRSTYIGPVEPVAARMSREQGYDLAQAMKMEMRAHEEANSPAAQERAATELAELEKDMAVMAQAVIDGTAPIAISVENVEHAADVGVAVGDEQTSPDADDASADATGAEAGGGAGTGDGGEGVT